MSQGTMNKAMIIGRLGRDPQLRYTPTGIPITSFTLATNNSYRAKDGKLVDQTDWHKVVAWSKLAEVCGQYLKKGALICVEGQLKTRYWDDKQGVKHATTEIVAETLKMLGRQSQAKTEELFAAGEAESEETPVAAEHIVEEESAEIPF